MDINDNQQINTFLKGMNTDVSDALIDSSQYRYAENLRLVTNTDSNSGELHLIDGTTVRYTFSDYDKIIYFTSIRNYVIAITRNETQADWTWSVYVSKDKGSNWTKIFGPCSEPIWKEDGTVAISGVTRWESDKNIKLYIADNTCKHSIIPIQLAESQWPAPGTTIPNDIEYLNGYQNTFLSPIKASIADQGGSIMSARVQYAYRMYKMGGAATTLSPLSNIISLYRDEVSGYEPLKVSGKAVELTIGIMEEYNLPYEELDHIQIFRINYVQNGQEPTINLILDDESKAWIDYIDDGTNLQEYSLSEFLALVQMTVYPKIIESKNDYLFAANLKYAQDDADRYIIEGDDSDIIDNIECNFIYSDFEEIPLDNWDYERDSQKRSLRRGETYRYGVIFYNSKGQASSVYPIRKVNGRYVTNGDITVPQFSPSRDIQFNISSTESEKFSVKRIGINVSIDRWPSDCVGYQVVRCLRKTANKKVLCQGITGLAVEQTKIGISEGDDRYTSEDTQGRCCTPGPITMQKLIFHAEGSYTQSMPSGDVLMFACPEYAYQDDDMKNILNSSSTKLSHVVSYQTRNSTTVNESIPYIYTHQNHTQCGPETYYSTTRYEIDDIVPDTLFEGNPPVRYSDSGQSITELGTIRCIEEDIIADYYSAGRRVQGDDDDEKVYFVNHFVPIAVDDLVSRYVEDNMQNKNIESFAYPKVPAYNSFSDNGQIRILDDITAIGGKEFVNWTIPLLLQETIAEDQSTEKGLRTNNGWSEDSDRPFKENTTKCFSPIGTGGKFILIHPKNKVSSVSLAQLNNGHPEHWLPITVTNIERTNPTGYGDIRYSTYYQFGSFRNKESGDDPTSPVSLDVWDGDSFFYVFNFNASHAWDDATYGHGISTTIYSVPIETDIDLRAQCGTMWVDTKTPYIQDTVGNFSSNYTQTVPAYNYNTAYNQEPAILSQSYSKYENIDSNNYDTRIHHSHLKTNNEHVDNWLQFDAADYIDVDSRFGQITDLRLFKDKLLYWQNNAVGIVSSNERTVLNDLDDNQIVLGTGGVLQRYDYISTLYGMKPDQFAETQSNTNLYWWDGYNKEILVYSGEMSTVPLGTVKSIRNYLNSHDENNKPYLFYDTKYKEVVNSVVNDESVVYNEQIEAFTSVYKFTPTFAALVDNNILTTNVLTVYNYNDNNGNGVTLFREPMYPLLKYVVNNNNTYTKVFDIITFGGRFYGGDDSGVNHLSFKFNTPLKQQSYGKGSSIITNREYDFRLDVPRNNDSAYGDRMRGKIMQCELKSDTNSTDFSLQYILTKYRMSWS